LKTDSKYKILLADDEPQNIKDLFQALNPESYRIFVASKGKSAVELALNQQSDASIMDCEMPEMEGMENLLTAPGTATNDYIKKPFGSNEIETRLQSTITHSLEQQKNYT